MSGESGHLACRACQPVLEVSGCNSHLPFILGLGDTPTAQMQGTTARRLRE